MMEGRLQYEEKSQEEEEQGPHFRSYFTLQEEHNIMKQPEAQRFNTQKPDVSG